MRRKQERSLPVIKLLREVVYHARRIEIAYGVSARPVSPRCCMLGAVKLFLDSSQTVEKIGTTSKINAKLFPRGLKSRQRPFRGSRLGSECHLGGKMLNAFQPLENWRYWRRRGGQHTGVPAALQPHPPPASQEGSGNRHCPPPRGVQSEDLANAAKAQERQQADMRAGRTGQEKNEKGKEPE